MHRDAQEVATSRVQVRDHRGEWELLAGVTPDLPVPLLISKDQGFQWSCQLLAERTDAPGRSEDIGGSEDSSDTAAGGEYSSATNPASLKFQQVT